MVNLEDLYSLSGNGQRYGRPRGSQDLCSLGYGEEIGKFLSGGHITTLTQVRDSGNKGVIDGLITSFSRARGPRRFFNKQLY